MDKYLKALNSTEVLNNSIPKLIDAFVSFYGEENREFITHKFNNLMFVGYQDENVLSDLVLKIKNEKKDELLKDLFSKIGIEYNDNNARLYMGYNYLENLEYSPINKLNNYINEVKKGSKLRIEEGNKKQYQRIIKYFPNLTYEDFINKRLTDEQEKRLSLGGYSIDDFIYTKDDDDKNMSKKRKESIDFISKVNHNITEDNIDYLIKNDKLNKYENIYNLFKESYNKFDSFVNNDIKSYIELSNKLKTLRTNIDKKYHYKLIEEFIDLAKDSEKDNIKQEMEEGYLKIYSTKAYDVIYGLGLKSTSKIKYFSSDSELDLNDNKVNDYKKNTIKENRIEYFKYMGIDLGNNYEDYINNEECKKIWPDSKLIDNFIEKSNYYNNEANIEFYTNLDSYKKTIEKIDSLNLLGSDKHLEPSSYKQQLTCVSPDIRLNNGNYELFNLVLIYSNADKHSDVKLIHELNHIYELSLVGVKDNEYSCICGWDQVAGELGSIKNEYEDTNSKFENKREYELFNEIINEMIAQRISSMMHNNGVFIFNDKNDYKDKGATSYERTLFLANEFFNSFTNEIIESRRNNNIDIILNKVGKDNFDNLNNLFHEFNDHFAGFDFFNLVNDIKNNADTERVRIYKALCNKRDNILSRMHEYSNNMNMGI